MARPTNGLMSNGDGAAKPVMSTPEKRQSASAPSSGGGLSYKALLFMSLLALQFGIQPIVTRRFTSREIIKSTVIFTQEAVKLAIAAVGISVGGKGWAEATAGWTLSSWIRLALLPALIYLVQNMCSLLAYQNLDAITYNVLNQTKTLSAALCCYLLLGKRQSSMQMLALLLLLTAALVMEKVLPLDALRSSYWTSGGGDGADDSVGGTVMSSLSTHHLSHGVLPIAAASFLSGLAGAITQRSLQAGNRQALLFTMELCVASMILLFASFVTSDDGRRVRDEGFFREWTPLTLVPILTNSAGGILVGLVIKHAGTVRKGFALIFGILLSGVVQSVLDEDKALSREEVAGGAIAAVSLWMHSAYPYVAKGNETVQPKATTTRTVRNGTVRRRGRKED